MSNARRYLGVELLGAKNSKTSVCVLEYFAREQKLFLIDLYDRITVEDHQSNDDAFVELVQELGGSQINRVGFSAPLTFPPCIECHSKKCETSGCSLPEAKWMQKLVHKNRHLNPNEFTSYTQRPIELWIRYEVLSMFPEALRFEIDETLGGNKAPLTARLHYLKKRLGHLGLKEDHIYEVWPKLSLSSLAFNLGISRALVQNYRNLEKGVDAREEIIEILSEHFGLFIYDRDVHKLAASLAAFDAFLCALTSWVADQGHCTKPPKGFPLKSGWIQFPLIAKR